MFTKLSLALPTALLAGASPRSFDASQLIEEVPETTANVSGGDLTGDGYPDLLAARAQAPRMIYFSGPGEAK